MARLTFSNVPTKSGGVVSGNISTGAGSPFGKGGQFASQVADIKATIAKAPEGTYDPQYWDQFLELDPEEFPEGFGDQFVPSDDPDILRDLYNIPSARMAMEKLANQPAHNYRWSQAQRNMVAKEKREHETTIALYVNQLMMQKNAPLIKAVEQHQRQKEIDQAVQRVLDKQVINQRITPLSMTPMPISTDRSWSNYAILGIGVVIFLIILRRRA